MIISDKQEALKAVQIDGFQLEHMSDNLKNDKEIVLLAIDNNGNALKYASEALKNDKEFFLKILQMLIIRLQDSEMIIA